MYKILVFGLFWIACNNGDEKRSDFHSNSDSINIKNTVNEEVKNDSFCLNENNFHQCCISFPKQINDSLIIDLERRNNPNENYLSLGGNGQEIIYRINNDSIMANIYLLSFKDAMQKLIIENVINDTLYLSLKLARNGKDDNFWIHKINFTYYNYPKRIKKIFLRF